MSVILWLCHTWFCCNNFITSIMFDKLFSCRGRKDLLICLQINKYNNCLKTTNSTRWKQHTIQVRLFEWVRHWFGSSIFVLVRWLKINSDYFCFWKHENILHQIKGRKLSMMSIYCKNFVPRCETVSFESKPWTSQGLIYDKQVWLAPEKSQQ